MDTQDDEEFTPFIPALWINEMDRTQAERVISNLYEVDSDVGRRQVLADVRLPRSEAAKSVGIALSQESGNAEYMDERRLKRQTERVVQKVLRRVQSYETIGKKEFEAILDTVIEHVH